VWRDQPERTLLGGKRNAVYGIRDDYLGFENPRIKFRQGENHSIAIFGLGDNVIGHRRTSKLFALWNSRSVKEFFKKHSFLSFLLFVVWVHNRERFPRHLFQINYGQNERSGNSTADSEFRDGWRTLGAHLHRYHEHLRQRSLCKSKFESCAALV